MTSLSVTGGNSAESEAVKESRDFRMEVDTLYLDNLDEYINDENRIITYKWLSRSLRVHVNQAKQMLYAFVQQQRNVKDNDGITVTYLVAGPTDDGSGNKVHKVSIVPEENLDVTKSHMSAVTSCHIYSVQKVKLKDTNSLYTADYDCLRENLLSSNKYSAITCLAAKIRTDAEHASLRNASSEAYQPPAQPKGSPKKGAGKTGKSQGGISSMFANASKKKEAAPRAEEKEVSTEKAPSKRETKPAKKPPAGVMSFFANQASKANGKAKNSEAKKADGDIKDQGPSKEAIKEKDAEIKEKEAHVQEKPQSNRSRGKSKKTADSDEEDKTRNTKRRRIKAIVDDSSEEEVNIEDTPPTPPREPSPEPASAPVTLVDDTDEEEEEEMEVRVESEASSKDKESKSVSKSPANGEKRRKRQRKCVPRTYIDDEGFMVTEKISVYESCTDESESGEPAQPASVAKEPPTKVTPKPQLDQKKDKKKTPPKKISPASRQPGKQTSLMSFFKKK